MTSSTSDHATTAPPGVRRRGVLLASVSAALAALAGCARSAPAPTKVEATQLGIVGLIVADVNRSLAFYRLLGLDLPSSVDGSSYRHRFENGNVLFWEQPAVIKSFDPTWSVPPPGDRRVVLEFGFSSVARLVDAYDLVRQCDSAGRVAPFDQGGGVTYAIVSDPDGNQVSLRHPATG